ncbi:hypothetical protein DCS_06328 [Drechmeria coniospora]|uniref:Uncharacterized protein n=1 Tax=Drechmeria coniospora TaxID=98403 RepID=A0A151GB84_DRECN|nr:hypothetical protein DCS_06328 [Drechmeria coniospora]KAH8836209.1 hypothetical protein RJ55_10077 [Drechmeria coniospora]KYK54370.1 hypothetical protein DCS_06328 [Drechmeria coniospora]
MQYSAALAIVFAAALALAAPAQFQGTPDTQYKEPYNNRNYINPGQINNYNPPAAYFPPGAAPARFNTYGPPAPLNLQATPSNSESEVPPVPVYDENQVQQYSDQMMMVD